MFPTDIWYMVEDRAEFHVNEGNVQNFLPYATDSYMTEIQTFIMCNRFQ